jgi:hypothetical protein
MDTAKDRRTVQRAAKKSKFILIFFVVQCQHIHIVQVVKMYRTITSETFFVFAPLLSFFL